MVTKETEAARFNSGKPMFSYIDFNLWKDMFLYTITINSKEECFTSILLAVSDLTKPNNENIRDYLSILKLVSYRLSLLYKDILLTDSKIPDLRAFEDMAYVLEFGAKKYARDNWRKGYTNKYSAADSLLRHLHKLMLGETHDEESGLHHIGHLMCNVMFLTNDLLYVDRDA